jgi:transcriptional regulator with GAF, ATPase, and Fis domain
VPRFQAKTGPVALENELKCLFEISKLIQESPVTEESFEEILKSVGRLVDFRSASLFVYSGETEKLEEVCSIGRTVDLINFVNFNMGAGISAWVAQKKRPIILNNLRKSQGGTHTKSFLSVPLIFEGSVTGVVNLAHDEQDAFTRRDAELIGIVSSLLSLMTERIDRRKTETKTQNEINSLNEKLGISSEKLGRTEIHGYRDDAQPVPIEKINNPLAIIAGNAQFLIMTMKNPGSSVIKRLKAIDMEASNIMTLINNMRSQGKFHDRNIKAELVGK